MKLFLMMFLLLMMYGALCVSCNSSPFYSIFGLVLMTLSSCMVLLSFGGTFISLILFLIYLGGMLVAFIFCVAVASEVYLEELKGAPMFIRFLFCFLVSYMFYLMVVPFDHFCGMTDELRHLSSLRGEAVGVSVVYGAGGGMLMTCVWALFLSLFVVLELTRGRSLGALRTI